LEFEYVFVLVAMFGVLAMTQAAADMVFLGGLAVLLLAGVVSPREVLQAGDQLVFARASVEQGMDVSREGTCRSTTSISRTSSSLTALFAKPAVTMN